MRCTSIRMGGNGGSIGICSFRSNNLVACKLRVFQFAVSAHFRRGDPFVSETNGLH